MGNLIIWASGAGNSCIAFIALDLGRYTDVFIANDEKLTSCTTGAT